MILILPLFFSWIMLIMQGRNNINNNENIFSSIISKYAGLISLIYLFNITIGLNYFQVGILILVLYWLFNDKESDINKKSNKFINVIYLYALLFLMSTIFIFYSSSILALFVSIELISFLMITFINLYIQDKYPGILYYLFSGLFSAFFILSLGYLYMGYTIAYSFLSLVFIWKLGLGPLHILMPHIYNSLSPKKIIFIDIICKYLLFYIFSRLIISIPINLNFIALTTIIIGSILILKEYNLLNILVYSSITNYGLLLISMSETMIFFIYLIFYSFMVIIYLYLITHVWILYSFKTNGNWYIILWFILLLNMIGIPPLTGFWIKFYLLQLLIINESYLILFIILLSLILLSSVYIRILLGFIINDKIIDIHNNNIVHSHFISSLIILLSFPIFI